MDLFFYREPEETKQLEEEEAPAGPEYAITDFNASGLATDGQWPGAEQSWTDAVPQPIAAAPGNWGTDTGKFIHWIWFLMILV